MAVGPNKRIKVLLDSGGKCAYCGETLDEVTFTIDHKVPMCRGGSHDIDNLLACCRWCNTSKGRSHIEDFRLRMAARHLPVRFNAEQLAYLVECGVAETVGFDASHAFNFEKEGVLA